MLEETTDANAVYAFPFLTYYPRSTPQSATRSLLQQPQTSMTDNDPTEGRDINDFAPSGSQPAIDSFQPSQDAQRACILYRAPSETSNNPGITCWSDMLLGLRYLIIY
jgi:hypothetical protein